MPVSTLTSDGLSIVCLLFEHDWNTEFTVSHFFPTDIAEGLSGRESRRPEAEELLLTVGVRIWAEDDEAQALRLVLATLGKGWVGVPILADQFLGADLLAAGARIYAAQRYIDLTSPAIITADDIPVSDHVYAPLVVGHITEVPAIEPAAGGLALCGLTLTEDSSWIFRIGINATVSETTIFPTPTDSGPTKLVPDWTSPPTQQPVHGLSFERIGHQREQTIAGEERALVWTCQADFTLTDKTEIARLLGFFRKQRGSWGSFPAPLWFTPGTPDVPGYAPHDTTVRFTERTLKLSFATPQVATAQVGFTQVPWEIAGVAGETPKQPARIYLYQITYDVPSPVVWRFTNGWRPLARTDDGTYTPAPMEHESIDGGLDLANEKLTLNSFLFEGNPLDLFNPSVLEGRMWLRIYAIETDPIDPNAATLVWYGSIAAAPQTGRKYAAECQWLGGITDLEIPNVRVGPMCNTHFLSVPCGHRKEDWAKAGTLSSKSGNVVVIAASDAAAANTYAPGKLEVGAGLTFESRFVTASTPVVGGQQLTLDRPLRQAVTVPGQAVTYYRTCDRSVATCKALDPTGWKARFRGHPNLSQVALSLPTQSSAPSGKK